MREKLNNERGLTLVELLAVIVILAIVGAIAFVMIGNIIENSKKDAAVADALQAINSAKLYETTQEPKFPVKISDLQKEGMLDTLYDPWDKEEYGVEETDKVSKDKDGNYSVVLGASNCKINNSEAKLIEFGREACGKTDSELTTP